MPELAKLLALLLLESPNLVIQKLHPILVLLGLLAVEVLVVKLG
jgi:hypothetical protein